MAIIRRISSKAKVRKIETYLKQECKTEEKLISGINCDSDNFSKQCEMTNLLYRKNQERNDRKYYHIIQSFSPKDNGKLTYEQAHKIGKQFAEKNFKGYEVLVVTHKDKEHIHNHFVVNSVSFETGKKYRADNRSLWQLRRSSNELCKENELVHSIHSLEKKAMQKIKSGELRKMLRGEDVWKAELRAQIKECFYTSKSETEFMEKMQEKYKVAVKERTRTVKGKKETIYEYKPEGFRKFFDGAKRLGEEYGKEYIRNGIIRRSQEETRENDRRTIGTGTIECAIRNRAIDLVGSDVKQREREIERADSEREENRTGIDRTESKTAERTR